jgi:ketosteroid isomerase-like protein
MDSPPRLLRRRARSSRGGVRCNESTANTLPVNYEAGVDLSRSSESPLMERDLAVSCLSRLHEAQSAFHVVWTVPGDNAIAGTYRGVEAVMSYFRRRRNLADRSFKLRPGDVLVGEGDLVAALTDGTALLHGAERRWSTIGLYRFRDQLISTCRLVPLDQAEFDRIWSVS